MAEQDIAREHALAEGIAFTWHELYLPDAEAGIRFYTEVLGWESQTMAMEGGDYPMLVANGRPIAGVQATRGNPEMAGVPPTGQPISRWMTSMPGCSGSTSTAAAWWCPP